MAGESNKITGKLELVLDDAALEAGLILTVSGEGDEWDVAAAIELITSQGVRVGREEQAKIESAFKALMGLEKGSRKVEVLSGQPPGLTVDDQLEWKDQEIPDEMQAQAQTVLAGAPTPHVFDVQVTREKVEEIQTIKSKLPFLKAKEEKVVKVVRSEQRIEVGIDPQPKAVGYLQANQIVAVIKHGTIGRDGKDLKGEIIPAAKPAKVKILLGGGVTQRGDEIRAEEAGFYRRGENWIDVLAYHEYKLEVYRSADQASCLLDYTPGTGEPPDPRLVMGRARELGFASDELIGHDEIRTLVADAHADARASSLIGAALSNASDAVFDIKVDDDGLNAVLNLKKGSGAGLALSLKEVGRAINARGLKGLDTERVRADILAFYRGSERELTKYKLIEGKLPTRGQDGRIAWSAEFVGPDRAQEIAKRLAGVEAGSDFPADKVERLAFVKKGQPVAELSAPTEGKPGLDIFGRIIAPVTGVEIPLKLDKSLERTGEVIAAQRDGVLEVARTDQAVFARIRDYHDGHLSIRVTESKMQAYIVLVAGTGETITLEKVREVANSQSVTHGIKDEVLADLIRKASSGEEHPEVLFAEAQEPVHQSGNKLHFHASVVMGRSFLVKEGGEGQNFAAKKDEEIAEIVPPTRNAVDGFDVTGGVLEAQLAPDLDIKLGENVRREDGKDGRVRFVANKDGEVFYDGNILEIKDTLTLAGDVNAKTGHVQFSGSINIKGSVADGYKVVAGGDLTVGQMVGRSLVSSEGSLTINGGVKGAGKAIVRAKNELRATYIEQSTVLAVAEIRVKNSCLDCQIRCNSRVRLESDKANLVGGRIKSRNGLETQNLGSARGTRTLVSFGQDYLVQDQIEVEERQLEKLKTRIIKIDSWLLSQDKKQAGGDPRIQKIRGEKLKAMKLLEQRGIRLFNLREKYEAHFDSEVIVRGSLYPGVVFESHGRTVTIDAMQKAVIVYFDEEDGKIKTRPLTA